MKKFTLLAIPIFIFSCTRIQYVGNTYQSTTTSPDVYVTESSIKKPYTIIGQGYIKTGLYNIGINWDKVQKKAIKEASEHGADAVLIVQKRAISPIPAISTVGSIDSVGKGIQIASRTETYYPVSSWHDILFLKYNR
jgi:hypothetical protein